VRGCDVLRLILISAALAALFQDPPNGGQEDRSSEWFDVTVKDPISHEIEIVVSGVGKKVDYENGAGVLDRVHVTVYTKPTDSEPAHKIHLFSNKCAFEGISPGGESGKGVLRFSEGLRCILDDSMRLWTTEGTFDVRTRSLFCPKATRLVHFAWPPQLDLASALLFMDPQDLEWLGAFGAPEPDFELAGEEFEFDAAAYVFTARRKGRIRVSGRPGDALRPGKKKPRPAVDETTELRSEGPLRLRNLGAPDRESPGTLHVTAERQVVLERRVKDSVSRARSESASIYFGVPPRSEKKADPRPQSAVLKGGVHIEESGGLQAVADQLEWSHRDSLLRLKGAPRVEVSLGTQRLQAREILVDQGNRVVDFDGDVVATFAPRQGAAPAKDGAGTMTLTPGDLRLRMDSSGRPVGIYAWGGVKITSLHGDAGAEALDAEGSEFEWDFIEGEGALRGVPFARIGQGANLVVAPLVTFRGESFDESLMVIKGPKLIKFFIEARPPRNPGADLLNAALGLGGLRRTPGMREPSLNDSATLLESSLGLPGLQGIPGRRESVSDFVITCDGDALFDQKSGFVKLVDRCSVRNQDSTLTADRLFVHLAPKERDFDRIIGLGNVRASRVQGGQTIQFEGETLELRKDENGHRVVTVIGHPKGRGVWGNKEFPFERVRYNLDTNKKMVDESTMPMSF